MSRVLPLRIVSRLCALTLCCVSLVSLGEALAVDLHPGDIIVSATDFNVQPYQEVLIRVDPSSGAIDVIASPTVGTGPAVNGNETLALDAKGQILAGRTTGPSGGILRINPVTGERGILSDASHGNGPVPELVLYLDDLADGSILAYDTGQYFSKSFVRFDATTGDRSVALAAIGICAAWMMRKRFGITRCSRPQ